MKIAIIPARFGSKRIKKKNIKNFYSKPMIYWAIKRIKESKLFDFICVSSDSNKILNIAKNYGVEILIKRPTNLSDDMTPTKSVIIHAIEYLEKMKIKFETICCVYPCNPFMLAEDLRRAFKIYKKNSSKFIFPVVEYSHPIQRALRINRKSETKPITLANQKKRTQDLERSYFDSGQFYYGSKSIWRSDKNLHNNGVPLIIPSWRVVDIDNLQDWKRAELLFKILKINGKKNIQKL
jgi:pseudaminic acid cytidylyltransferase